MDEGLLNGFTKLIDISLLEIGIKIKRDLLAIAEKNDNKLTKKDILIYFRNI